MNLAIDIGNTSIKKASFDNFKLNKINHLNYSKKNISKILQFLKDDFKKYEEIIICSVVPEINTIIKKNFSYEKRKFVFVNKIKLKKYVHQSVNLKHLGNDRIINVLSVTQLFKNNNNFIIIDLGTATTIDIIIKKKYFGGIILPGLKTSYLNLISLASEIKSIKFEEENEIIGKNTKGALLAGYNTGYKLMIDAYLNLLKKKFPKNFKLIFTGGYANNIIANKKNCIYKDDLTLMGLISYKQNFIN